MKKILLSTLALCSGIVFATSEAHASTSSWGAYHKDNHYFTVTSNNYTIYGDKEFNSRSHTSRYYKKTLRVKGYYLHQNGHRYLSLYNNKNQWVGYVNWRSGKYMSSPWGSKLSGSKPIDTCRGNYNIYSNKEWKKRATNQQYKGKVVRCDGYYNHFNGERYYSMKYNGQWIGYMNKEGAYNKKTNGTYQFVLDRMNQVKNKFGARVIRTYTKGDTDYYGTGHGEGLAVDLSVGDAKRVGDSVWKKNQAMANYILNNYSHSTEYYITNNQADGPYWQSSNITGFNTTEMFKNPTAAHVNHLCWHFKKASDVFNF